MGQLSSNARILAIARFETSGRAAARVCPRRANFLLSELFVLRQRHGSGFLRGSSRRIYPFLFSSSESSSSLAWSAAILRSMIACLCDISAGRRFAWMGDDAVQRKTTRSLQGPDIMQQSPSVREDELALVS